MKDQYEIKADLAEALELMREWRPFYQAVYSQTGCRKQARAALKWAIQIEKELCQTLPIAKDGLGLI